MTDNGFTLIDSGLGYYPASSDPLCADIFVYEGSDHLWLFDVGYGEAALERVLALGGPFQAVISHFHQDHMGNLQQLEPDGLWLGQYTLRHAGRHSGSARVVSGAVEPEPGLKLFPIPSSHAKGCVGMQAGGYALLGDAAYSTSIKGRVAFNATLLYDTICTLESLSASKFILSHGEPVVREREDVLGELREAYSRRVQGEPYIFLD